jgi:glucose-6-phosphate 1-epimerase
MNTPPISRYPVPELADLPDDDWLQMLCVEAAQIGRPVTLAPGQDWVARQGFEV